MLVRDRGSFGFCCKTGKRSRKREGVSFPHPDLAKIQPRTVIRDTTPAQGYNVIISDINDTQCLSEGSEGITNYRRKRNMGHIHWYVSVWVKEDKMCRILNCFPTLSEAHSLNPVNDYMRYLRYHLQNQLFPSHISKKICGSFFFFIIHFFTPALSHSPSSLSLCLCLQSFVERLAL